MKRAMRLFGSLRIFRVFGALLCLAPLAGDGQGFTYITNAGTITITGYTGPGGTVEVPGIITGLPVTTLGYRAFIQNTTITNVVLPDSLEMIGVAAFAFCTELPSIRIPRSVTKIASALTEFGYYSAFSGCSSLAAIVVDPLNATYTSAGGVLFSRSNTVLERYPDGKSPSYAIPEGVTTIAGGAFTHSSFTIVTVPRSVSTIEDGAFADPRFAAAVAFWGDAPQFVGPDAFNTYWGPPDPYATAYYLPGTKGWGPKLADASTALWCLPQPVILNFGATFGVQTNRFGFIVSWATNAAAVVEASANVANSTWTPVSTNTLINGWTYFSDPDWMSHTARVYRARSR